MNTNKTTYEPVGIKFFSNSRKQECMFCTEAGHSFYQWILYKHPDGQWVSLRKATQSDSNEIAGALLKKIGCTGPMADEAGKE